MVKKPVVKISKIAVIRTIVFLFIGFVLFTGYVDTVDFLTNSPLFDVKDVSIDTSIRFIDVRGLKELKGRNIFTIDIKKLERQIARQYPYISQLRVMRDLPDRILILAKKREPLMQVPAKGKYLLVDTEGVALFYSLQPAAVPQVRGLPLQRKWLFLGGRLRGPEADKVIDILNIFRASPYLRKWRIDSVEAGNLSKIDMTVNENMHVILDQDDTEDKIEVLLMLLSGNKINLNTVKYIDLRFKEPIIAANGGDNT